MLNRAFALSVFLSAVSFAAAGEFSANGARPYSLGNAYIGAADDASAAFFNPAGIGFQSGRKLMGTYGSPVVPSNRPAQTRGSFSLVESSTSTFFSWSMFGVHESTQNVRENQTIGFNLAVLPYSYAGYRNFSIGLNMKYITDQVEGAAVSDQSAAAVDAGVLWAVSDDVSLGISGQNLNRPRAFADRDSRLPATYGAGLAWRTRPGRTVFLDTVQTESEEGWGGRGGVEQKLLDDRLSVRLGSNRDSFTAGFGIDFFAGRIDYGYSYPYQFSKTPRQHVVSLGLQWGGKEARPVKPAVEEEKAKIPRRLNRFLEKVDGLKRRSELPVGPEDVIEVDVKNHPELTTTAEVDSWGYVQLPFIEELKVDSLHVDEIETKLADIYQGFIRNPQVEVNVSTYNSRVVYVFGTVAKPGKYRLDDRKARLRDVIVEAGLPTDRAASWRTFVIRQTDENPVYYRVNLSRVLYRGILDNNIQLQAGDIIYVPMGFFDRIATFIGRLLSPIVGLPSTLLVN